MLAATVANHFCGAKAMEPLELGILASFLTVAHPNNLGRRSAALTS
jgi:hypothetical protein